MRSGRMAMFAYPGRKDTIKACFYVKELVRFMLYRLEHHEYGVELYNCCFEPAYTIQHIVEAMKKVTELTQFVPDIPNWVIMPMARAAMLLGSPMGICPARVKKLANYLLNIDRINCQDNMQENGNAIFCLTGCCCPFRRTMLYACGAHDRGRMLLAALYTDGLFHNRQVLVVLRWRLSESIVISTAVLL